jgi:soluble lytic murein transglycosylase
MDYANFDPMGSYTGDYNSFGETPEEKRRRLAAEAQKKSSPVTQTIKTDPVTGQQTMTVSGSVEDLSSRNPLTPTVVEPVAPEAPAPVAEKRNFQLHPDHQAAIDRVMPPSVGGAVAPIGLSPQQVQAESGGRDYTAGGQPLTSPAGAMFRNQVMPSTAANPGFGIRPAASQTPEEYNRVGEEYMNAMRQKFGNEPAAVAAYNAGPGTVQKNLVANQGQLNTAALPQETQGYLQKVLGPVLNAVVPSAQAQPAPRTQPQPALQPVNPAAPAVNQMPMQPATLTGTAATLPGLQAQPQVDQMFKAFTTNQDNPEMMRKFALDPAIPKAYQMAASSQAFSDMQQQRETARVQKQFEQDPQGTVARLLKEKSDEGSWGKWLLFGLMGAGAAAGAEGEKLGIGARWEQQIDQNGNAALVKVRKDGLPLEGINLNTNEMLTPDQLVDFGGGLSGQKADYVGGSVVNDKSGTIGRLVSRNGRTMVESGGRYFPATTEWRNNTVGTDVANAARMALVDIQKRGAGKAAEVISEVNAKYGTNFSADSAGLAAVQRIAGGSSPVGATVPTGAPVGAPQPGGGPMTPAQVENRGGAQKEVSEAGGKILSGESDWLDKLDIIDEGIKGAKGKNNLGTIGTGVIPGERAAGKYVLGSKDARNTDDALNAVKTVAAAGMKVLGANPTDADRNYLTANIPDENWSGPQVAEWLESRKAFVNRKLKMAREQVESGGGSATPSGAPGTPSNPIKLKL